MDLTAFSANWALWAALVPAAIVVVAVVSTVWSRSGPGRLRRCLRDHGVAKKDLARAQTRLQRARNRLERLSGRKERVKPRVLQELRDRVADLEALEKIADDRHQVTANHVRKVIYEDFPPKAHDGLRARYLPQDVADGRPFRF